MSLLWEEMGFLVGVSRVRVLWSVDLSQGLGQFPSPSPGPINTSESLLRLRL